MRYKLAPGTQVREEDFGLLFYTMFGPRLYFVSCGNLLRCSFFEGTLTLDQWMEKTFAPTFIPKARIAELEARLNLLKEKGIIIEC